MKMKEVCEKTGLTDRAVRLYIENGLVSPRYNESYAGRRNIDFSDTDVDILKEIATLRKASFSIAEIRVLKSEPDRATEILKTVTDNTQKRITADTEILSCLMPLLEKDGIGIEDICRSLNNPVIEKTEVPKEDMEAPYVLKILKYVFAVIGGLALVLNLVYMILVLYIALPSVSSVLYPDYSGLGVWCAVCVGIILLSLIILPMKKKTKEKRKTLIKRSAVSLIIAGILVISTYFTSVYTLLVYYLGTDVISYTADAENYMVFDDEKAREALSEFLPEEIPEAAETEYSYRYTDVEGFGAPENQTDVFLELELYGEAFESIVEYYKSLRPKDSKREPRTFEKGSWKIICYREDGEEAPSNYEALFAYNEESETVRFICRYGNVAVKGAGMAEYWIDDYKW